MVVDQWILGRFKNLSPAVDGTGLWKGVREWACGWASPESDMAIRMCHLQGKVLVAFIFLSTLCIVACRKYTLGNVFLRGPGPDSFSNESLEAGNQRRISCRAVVNQASRQ